MWGLDERLAADTLPVCELELSAVRLMNDSRFPWLILVPRRVGAREWHHLPEPDQALLLRETMLAARTIETRFRPDKLNIGALGNLVPQLHVHVIGRSRGDPAWPGPVWGSGAAVPLDPTMQASLPAELAHRLAEASSAER